MSKPEKTAVEKEGEAKFTKSEKRKKRMEDLMFSSDEGVEYL